MRSEPHVAAISLMTDQCLRNGKANFEDENYSVSTPMFGIHGNHDDPAGVGAIAIV